MCPWLEEELLRRERKCEFEWTVHRVIEREGGSEAEPTGVFPEPGLGGGNSNVPIILVVPEQSDPVT